MVRTVALYPQDLPLFIGFALRFPGGSRIGKPLNADGWTKKALSEADHLSLGGLSEPTSCLCVYLPGLEEAGFPPLSEVETLLMIIHRGHSRKVLEPQNDHVFPWMDDGNAKPEGPSTEGWIHREVSVATWEGARL